MGIPSLSKILYVEDEQDIQEVVSMSLVDLGGYNLEICSSGRESLEVICDFKPDLVLLDVMMPDMDGPTVLYEIRKIKKFLKTPVIFLTAKAQMHEIVSYRELGVLGIIRKPFDPITISETINDLWRKFHTQNA